MCLCIYVQTYILSCILTCICEYTVAETAQNARAQRGWDQVHICSDMSTCICLETSIEIYRFIQIYRSV